VESVDKEHHLATRGSGGVGRRGAIFEIVAAPSWQLALRTETEKWPAHGRDRVGQRGEPAGPGCVARQVGDRTVAQGMPALRLVARQVLDLHPRHVDARRALALAALA